MTKIKIAYSDGEVSMYTDNKPSIFIVDNSPIVRKGLKEMLLMDYNVCGETENSDNTLKVISDSSPDLLILGSGLDEDEGLSLIYQLKKQFPGLSVLVFSMNSDISYVECVLKAGACGCVDKDENENIILEAIRDIIDDKPYISKRVASKIAEQIVRPISNDKQCEILSELSRREKEVFMMIGQGHSVSEVADQICLSPRTVQTYANRIKVKLDFERNRDLIKYAIKYVSGS